MNKQYIDTAKAVKLGARRAGKKRGGRGQKMPQLDRAREIIRPKLLAHEPLSPHKLQEQYGISHYTFDAAITAELARREALADPIIDPKTLPKTAQAKLAAAERQQRKRIEAEYNTRRMKEIEEHIKRIVPDLEKARNAAWASEERYREFLAQAPKAFTVEQFKTILMVLHPDGDRSADKRKEAFTLFNAKRFALTGEKDR